METNNQIRERRAETQLELAKLFLEKKKARHRLAAAEGNRGRVQRIQRQRPKPRRLIKNCRTHTDAMRGQPNVNGWLSNHKFACSSNSCRRLR